MNVDRTWHKGLLHKLKPHLPNNLYSLIEQYLKNRSFMVSIQNETSTERPIRAGVPQGSCWGPYLYSIYCHDIPLPSSDTQFSGLYADDLVYAVCDPDSEIAAQRLQTQLHILGQWCTKWRVKINPSKSCAVTYTYKRRHTEPTLYYNQHRIPNESQYKYLGVTLDKRLTFQHHVSDLRTRIKNRANQLGNILNSTTVSLQNKVIIFKTMIQPIWTYAASVWGSCSRSQFTRLEQMINSTLQKRIVHAPPFVRNDTIYRDLDIDPPHELLLKEMAKFVERNEDHLNPLVAEGLLPPPLRRLTRPRHIRDIINN